MNNAEIEMILQELLKEILAIKSFLSNIPKTTNEEKESIVNDQLDSVLKGLGVINNNIKIIAKNQKAEAPAIDYSPIFKFEEKLQEFIKIQLLSPPDQLIKHEHSFKNWQWPAVLFLFIASTLVLGWYAMDNYYASKDLKVKYEFVRKEMPEHIRKLDSVYRINPEWIIKYDPLKQKPVKKNKKDR